MQHDPRNVFDYPDKHWHFLTADADTKFEGQYFDRKEVGRAEAGNYATGSQVNGLIEQIKECISAFANANKQGGLLVLGIAKTGEVKGIDHLNDEQRSRITGIHQLLRHHSTQCRLHTYPDVDGNDHLICLIYTAHATTGICETPDKLPQAWYRQGSQNIVVDQALREQLLRDKRIVDYERMPCCPYDPHDLDPGVMREFRHAAQSRFDRASSDDELLHQVGAIIRNQDNNGYFFTHAGLLFFAANPQRVLSWSYIRLLRFEVTSEQYRVRGLPTLDKDFSGPITKQIRDLRAFFKDSGFFKTYQRRNPDGGFRDEPELPFTAVDESIVNAVAHRDYATQRPIECARYQDACTTINPGPVQQRDHHVPDHFSLDTTKLVSTPRNPQLISWLRMLSDERGAPFIQALGEGTRQMEQEMSKLQLPAPIFDTGISQTIVTLLSNAPEREARLRAESAPRATEFTNLFPLAATTVVGTRFDSDALYTRQREIVGALRDALIAQGWYIDRDSFSRVVAHQRGADFPIPDDVARIVRFYPAYVFQLRFYWGQAYLCIDYKLEEKNVQSVVALLRYMDSSKLINTTAVVQWQGWHRGKIVEAGAQQTRVQLFDFEQEVQVPSQRVIPNLSRDMIDYILGQQKVKFDLFAAIKQYSLAREPNAARIRADYTQAIANELSQNIFPVVVGDINIALESQAVGLSHQAQNLAALRVESLSEPQVEFSQRHETGDIRDGITRFGAYDHTPKTLELVPICVPSQRQNMAELIERLKTGKYKYRGAERTFSTRLTYTGITTVPTPEQTLNECQRLLRERPEWIGDPKLDRIFLIYTPEQGYTSDNEQAPYYRIKRFLLEQGIPCQMVDTPILRNPDLKDLNLALNIITKCGITPWVLSDAMPDADFFVGLSYTENRRREGERLMGYANVFNQYGRWEFYSGNTETFQYRERTHYFQLLVEHTLARLNLTETPNIYFHYSAKFSREDREAILTAARRVRPQGTYSFVWVNAHHTVRLYDSRPETDGSLSRGRYVIASPYQIYLSTTGYNPYRKVLGTPQMLEANIRLEQPDGKPSRRPDLRALAVQLLSLTKLNWASTDSLCGEPITTKFAGDIAYLTSAFLRQGGTFTLHPVLETTPWFV